MRNFHNNKHLNLIAILLKDEDDTLRNDLDKINFKFYEKVELLQWKPLLERFDKILHDGSKKYDKSPWLINCDISENNELKKLIMSILKFMNKLYDHATGKLYFKFHKNLYALLFSSDLNIIINVLDVLLSIMKKSNSIAKTLITPNNPLGLTLYNIAQTWGGKINGLTLAQCCQDLPIQAYPRSCTSLHFEFYPTQTTSESSSNEINPLKIEDDNDMKKNLSSPPKIPKKNRNVVGNSLITIHVDEVDKLLGKYPIPSHVMHDLFKRFEIPDSQKMQLFCQIRLAYNFSNYPSRLLSVKARLKALTLLMYSKAFNEKMDTFVYHGFIEELYELLANLLSPPYEESAALENLDLKVVALKTLTSFIANYHYSVNNFKYVKALIENGQLGSHNGLLPTIVKRYVENLPSWFNNNIPEKDIAANSFTISTKTAALKIEYGIALFSLLYHLASADLNEADADVFVSSGIMKLLLNLITSFKLDPKFILFETRAVRIIDMVSAFDMNTFYGSDGPKILLNRFQKEIEVCVKEQPYVIPHNCPILLGKGLKWKPSHATDTTSSLSQAEIDAAMEMSTETNVLNRVITYLIGNTESINQSGSAMTIDNEDETTTSTSKPLTTNGEKPDSSNDKNICYLAYLYTHSDTAVKHMDDDGKEIKSQLKIRSSSRAKCHPARAALLKSILNLLKNVVSEPVQANQFVHQIMNPNILSCLKHIVSNVEYYGSTLFLLALDIVSNFIFSEPGELPFIQKSGVTDIMLKALLDKEFPSTRKMMTSLPTIFTSLCLNQRGMRDFVSKKPFDKLFWILVSPQHLHALRAAPLRRSRAAVDDTEDDSTAAEPAQDFGAMIDELLRHQPTLKTDAMTSICNVLSELIRMGTENIDSPIGYVPPISSSHQGKEVLLPGTLVTPGTEALVSDDHPTTNTVPTNITTTLTNCNVPNPNGTTDVRSHDHEGDSHPSRDEVMANDSAQPGAATVAVGLNCPPTTTAVSSVRPTQSLDINVEGAGVIGGGPEEEYFDAESISENSFDAGASLSAASSYTSSTSSSNELILDYEEDFDQMDIEELQPPPASAATPATVSSAKESSTSATGSNIAALGGLNKTTAPGHPSTGDVDEIKRHFLDYLYNVLKFLEAIITNGYSHTDHCLAFVNKRGIDLLLQMVTLPILPLDFPRTKAFAAYISVFKLVAVPNEYPRIARYLNVLVQDKIHLLKLGELVTPAFPKSAVAVTAADVTSHDDVDLKNDVTSDEKRSWLPGPEPPKCLYILTATRLSHLSHIINSLTVLKQLNLQPSKIEMKKAIAQYWTSSAGREFLISLDRLELQIIFESQKFDDLSENFRKKIGRHLSLFRELVDVYSDETYMKLVKTLLEICSAPIFYTHNRTAPSSQPSTIITSANILSTPRLRSTTTTTTTSSQGTTGRLTTTATTPAPPTTATTAEEASIVPAVTAVNQVTTPLLPGTVLPAPTTTTTLFPIGVGNNNRRRQTGTVSGTSSSNPNWTIPIPGARTGTRGGVSTAMDATGKLPPFLHNSNLTTLLEIVAASLTFKFKTVFALYDTHKIPTKSRCLPFLSRFVRQFGQILMLTMGSSPSDPPWESLTAEERRSRFNNSTTAAATIAANAQNKSRFLRSFLEHKTIMSYFYVLTSFVLRMSDDQKQQQTRRQNYPLTEKDRSSGLETTDHVVSGPENLSDFFDFWVLLTNPLLLYTDPPVLRVTTSMNYTPSWNATAIGHPNISAAGTIAGEPLPPNSVNNSAATVPPSGGLSGERGEIDAAFADSRHACLIYGGSIKILTQLIAEYPSFSFSSGGETTTLLDRDDLMAILGNTVTGVRLLANRCENYYGLNEYLKSLWSGARTRLLPPPPPPPQPSTIVDLGLPPPPPLPPVSVTGEVVPPATTVLPPPPATTTAAATRQQLTREREEWHGILSDMGFQPALIHEALRNCFSLEHATEYLLSAAPLTVTNEITAPAPPESAPTRPNDDSILRSLYQSLEQTEVAIQRATEIATAISRGLTISSSTSSSATSASTATLATAAHTRPAVPSVQPPLAEESAVSDENLGASATTVSQTQNSSGVSHRPPDAGNNFSPGTEIIRENSTGIHEDLPVVNTITASINELPDELNEQLIFGDHLMMNDEKWIDSFLSNLDIDSKDREEDSVLMTHARPPSSGNEQQPSSSSSVKKSTTPASSRPRHQLVTSESQKDRLPTIIDSIGGGKESRPKSAYDRVKDIRNLLTKFINTHVLIKLDHDFPCDSNREGYGNARPMFYNYRDISGTAELLLHTARFSTGTHEKFTEFLARLIAQVESPEENYSTTVPVDQEISCRNDSFNQRLLVILLERMTPGELSQIDFQRLCQTLIRKLKGVVTTTSPEKLLSTHRREWLLNQFLLLDTTLKCLGRLKWIRYLLLRNTGDHFAQVNDDVTIIETDVTADDKGGHHFVVEVNNNAAIEPNMKADDTGLRLAAANDNATIKADDNDRRGEMLVRPRLKTRWRWFDERSNRWHKYPDSVVNNCLDPATLGTTSYHERGANRAKGTLGSLDFGLGNDDQFTRFNLAPSPFVSSSSSNQNHRQRTSSAANNNNLTSTIDFWSLTHIDVDENNPSATTTTNLKQPIYRAMDFSLFEETKLSSLGKNGKLEVLLPKPIDKSEDTSVSIIEGDDPEIILEPVYIYDLLNVCLHLLKSLTTTPTLFSSNSNASSADYNLPALLEVILLVCVRFTKWYPYAKHFSQENGPVLSLRALSYVTSSSNPIKGIDSGRSYVTLKKLVNMIHRHTFEDEITLKYTFNMIVRKAFKNLRIPQQLADAAQTAHNALGASSAGSGKLKKTGGDIGLPVNAERLVVRDWYSVARSLVPLAWRHGVLFRKTMAELFRIVPLQKYPEITEDSIVLINMIAPKLPIISNTTSTADEESVGIESDHTTLNRRAVAILYYLVHKLKINYQFKLSRLSANSAPPTAPLTPRSPKTTSKNFSPPPPPPIPTDFTEETAAEASAGSFSMKDEITYYKSQSNVLALLTELSFAYPYVSSYLVHHTYEPSPPHLIIPFPDNWKDELTGVPFVTFLLEHLLPDDFYAEISFPTPSSTAEADSLTLLNRWVRRINDFYCTCRLFILTLVLCTFTGGEDESHSQRRLAPVVVSASSTALISRFQAAIDKYTHLSSTHNQRSTRRSHHHHLQTGKSFPYSATSKLNNVKCARISRDYISILVESFTLLSKYHHQQLKLRRSSTHNPYGSHHAKLLGLLQQITQLTPSRTGGSKLGVPDPGGIVQYQLLKAAHKAGLLKRLVQIPRKIKIEDETFASTVILTLQTVETFVKLLVSTSTTCPKVNGTGTNPLTPKKSSTPHTQSSHGPNSIPQQQHPPMSSANTGIPAPPPIQGLNSLNVEPSNMAAMEIADVDSSDATGIPQDDAGLSALPAPDGYREDMVLDEVDVSTALMALRDEGQDDEGGNDVDDYYGEFHDDDAPPLGGRNRTVPSDRLRPVLFRRHPRGSRRRDDHPTSSAIILTTAGPPSRFQRRRSSAYVYGDHPTTTILRTGRRDENEEDDMDGDGNGGLNDSGTTTATLYVTGIVDDNNISEYEDERAHHRRHELGEEEEEEEEGEDDEGDETLTTDEGEEDEGEADYDDEDEDIPGIVVHSRARGRRGVRWYPGAIVDDAEDDSHEDDEEDDYDGLPDPLAQSSLLPPTDNDGLLSDGYDGEGSANIFDDRMDTYRDIDDILAAAESSLLTDIRGVGETLNDRPISGGRYDRPGDRAVFRDSAPTTTLANNSSARLRVPNNTTLGNNNLDTIANMMDINLLQSLLDAELDANFLPRLSAGSSFSGFFGQPLNVTTGTGPSATGSVSQPRGSAANFSNSSLALYTSRRLPSSTSDWRNTRLSAVTTPIVSGHPPVLSVYGDALLADDTLGVINASAMRRLSGGPPRQSGDFVPRFSGSSRVMGGNISSEPTTRSGTLQQRPPLPIHISASLGDDGGGAPTSSVTAGGVRISFALSTSGANIHFTTNTSGRTPSSSRTLDGDGNQRFTSLTAPPNLPSSNGFSGASRTLPPPPAARIINNPESVLYTEEDFVAPAGEGGTSQGQATEIDLSLTYLSSGGNRTLRHGGTGMARRSRFTTPPPGAATTVGPFANGGRGRYINWSSIPTPGGVTGTGAGGGGSFYVGFTDGRHSGWYYDNSTPPIDDAEFEDDGGVFEGGGAQRNTTYFSNGNRFRYTLYPESVLGSNERTQGGGNTFVRSSAGGPSAFYHRRLGSSTTAYDTFSSTPGDWVDLSRRMIMSSSASSAPNYPSSPSQPRLQWIRRLFYLSSKLEDDKNDGDTGEDEDFYPSYPTLPSSTFKRWCEEIFMLEGPHVHNQVSYHKHLALRELVREYNVRRESYLSRTKVTSSESHKMATAKKVAKEFDTGDDEHQPGKKKTAASSRRPPEVTPLPSADLSGTGRGRQRPDTGGPSRLPMTAIPADEEMPEASFSSATTSRDDNPPNTELIPETARPESVLVPPTTSTTTTVQGQVRSDSFGPIQPIQPLGQVGTIITPSDEAVALTLEIPATSMGIIPEEPTPFLDQNRQDISSTSHDIPPKKYKIVLGDSLDPSFLTALPENIRKEVMSEQIRLRNIEINNDKSSLPPSSPNFEPVTVDVCPTFYAALPQNIRQEILSLQADERERQITLANRRKTNYEASQLNSSTTAAITSGTTLGNSNPAASSSALNDFDPAIFIHSLPFHLRQQVLSDLDDSVVALLPDELAREARNLQRNIQNRHRRLQQSLFSGGNWYRLSNASSTANDITATPNNALLASGVSGGGGGRITTASRLHPHHHHPYHQVGGGTAFRNSATTGGASAAPSTLPKRMIDYVDIAELLALYLYRQCHYIENLPYVTAHPVVNSCSLSPASAEDCSAMGRCLTEILREVSRHAGTFVWLVSSLLQIMESPTFYLSRHGSEEQQESSQSDIEISYDSERNTLTHVRCIPCPSAKSHQAACNWLTISLKSGLGSSVKLFKYYHVALTTTSRATPRATMPDPLKSNVISTPPRDSNTSKTVTWFGAILPDPAVKRVIQKTMIQVLQVLSGLPGSHNTFGLHLSKHNLFLSHAFNIPLPLPQTADKPPVTTSLDALSLTHFTINLPADIRKDLKVKIQPPPPPAPSVSTAAAVEGSAANTTESSSSQQQQPGTSGVGKILSPKGATIQFAFVATCDDRYDVCTVESITAPSDRNHGNYNSYVPVVPHKVVPNVWDALHKLDTGRDITLQHINDILEGHAFLTPTTTAPLQGKHQQQRYVSFSSPADDTVDDDADDDCKPVSAHVLPKLNLPFPAPVLPTNIRSGKTNHHHFGATPLDIRKDSHHPQNISTITTPAASWFSQYHPPIVPEWFVLNTMYRLMGLFDHQNDTFSAGVQSTNSPPESTDSLIKVLASLAETVSQHSLHAATQLDAALRSVEKCLRRAAASATTSNASTDIPTGIEYNAPPGVPPLSKTPTPGATVVDGDEGTVPKKGRMESTIPNPQQQLTFSSFVNPLGMFDLRPSSTPGTKLIATTQPYGIIDLKMFEVRLENFLRNVYPKTTTSDPQLESGSGIYTSKTEGYHPPLMSRTTVEFFCSTKGMDHLNKALLALAKIKLRFGTNPLFDKPSFIDPCYHYLRQAPLPAAQEQGPTANNAVTLPLANPVCLGPSLILTVNRREIVFAPLVLRVLVKIVSACGVKLSHEIALFLTTLEALELKEVRSPLVKPPDTEASVDMTVDTLPEGRAVPPSLLTPKTYDVVAAYLNDVDEKKTFPHQALFLQLLITLEQVYRSNQTDHKKRNTAARPGDQTDGNSQASPANNCCDIFDVALSSLLTDLEGLWKISSDCLTSLERYSQTTTLTPNPEDSTGRSSHPHTPVTTMAATLREEDPALVPPQQYGPGETRTNDGAGAEDDEDDPLDILNTNANSDTPDWTLLLQPTVEAFFRVYTKILSATEASNGESRPTYASVLRNEVPAPNQTSSTTRAAPISTAAAAPLVVTTEQPEIQHPDDTATTLLPIITASATTSAAPLVIDKDASTFLDFATAHRQILNRILRQIISGTGIGHRANTTTTRHPAITSAGIRGGTGPGNLGPFSVLAREPYSHLLDFDIKRRYFRDTLAASHDINSRPPGGANNAIGVGEDFPVHVRRNQVFEDSYRELHRQPASVWKSRFYIVFEGEEGQDAGGLLREWYSIIAREIFNPNYALFQISPGDKVTYTINPSSHCNSNHLSYFKFVGRVIGKALYDNKHLECYFTRSFYKHILGKPVKYTDMESEDYDFYQGLVYLLEHNVESLGYDLTFSTQIQEFGVTETRDLKPDGRNLLVTEDIKKEYVTLLCQMKMTGAIKQQLKSFLEGFYDIIPRQLISIFNEQELELFISGLPKFDIEDLKLNTEYHKYQPDSLQIKWFWSALKSFDPATKAKFLQFVTGTSKVPLQGFSTLEGMNGVQKFQIYRDNRSTDRLPSAHTCFNQLDLPAYDSYEKLRAMLIKAIDECSEGFGLA